MESTVSSVSSTGRGAFSPPFRLSEAEKNASVLVLAVFLLGAAAGSVMGLFGPRDLLPPDLGALFSVEPAPGSFVQALLSSAQFPLFALLLSTSYLGVFLIPAAAFFRAFLLSCSVAALFSSYSYYGFLCAFLTRGVPALFSVPIFILLSCDCLLMAQNLFRLKLECRNGPLPSQFAFHLFFAAAAVPLEAWYGTAVLPVLLQGV